MRSKVNNYMYYIIVGVISAIIMFVFPMMGSSAGLEINFPTTVGGWIVYVGTSLLTAIANMMIFFSFMEQAKLNVAKDENYCAANEILLKLSLKNPDKTKIPRSPGKWQKREYTRKGLAMFFGSIASCFALTNAILRFDVVALISYTIAVIFAVIFGLFQMKVAEEYWTNEYFQYAKYEEQKAEEKAAEEIKTEVLTND